MPQEFFLPFLKHEQVAKDAYTFYFDRTKTSFDFLPGQYIRMFLDVPNPDERGNARFFSITSSPLNKEYLTITTRIIQSAFKKFLLTLQPGTTVRFFGPNGQFVLKEEEMQPHIFLAGGIGVTPVHSMFLYASETNLVTPLTLCTSFSTVEEMVFYDDFIKIQQSRQNIKSIYTITHPEESQKEWSGEKGRITGELIKKYAPNFAESMFYISGPPIMVTAMEEIVHQLQISQDRIRKENFTGY